MEEGRSSATAVASAMVRAAHLVLDDEPKIFRDPLAVGLSGVGNETALQATLEAIHVENARRSTPEIAQKLYSYARAVTVMRQRYTEDELDKAVERGVAQYVILGPGSIPLPTAVLTSLRPYASSRWTIPPPNRGSEPVCKS